MTVGLFLIPKLAGLPLLSQRADKCDRVLNIPGYTNKFTLEMLIKMRIS